MTDNNKNRVQIERELWPNEAEELKKKRNRNRLTIMAILGSVVVFVMGYLLGESMPVNNAPTTVITSNNQINSDPDLEKVSEILDIMSNKWYFAKDIDNIKTRLIDEALYGMTTNEEDPHTTYMSAEEIDSFTQSINMNFVGIGVQFNHSDGIDMITRVFKNSPAEKAGVQAGDIINKVDGVSVEGMTSDEISDLVKGESGTVVTIEFIRQGEPISIEITRDEVSTTAFGEMISNNIGYLEIMQFGSTTSDEVHDYLEDMSNHGMTKLIIDLRDNGGGYLDALVHIANYLLPKDTMVMQQEYPNGTISNETTNGGQYTNIEKIVILVNGNTASASEVLTLGLKENRENDVIIIGTTTYGKGTVQVTQSFADGSALKYTTSKWLSPNSEWINGVGIEPDIVEELPDILNTAYIQMEEDDSYAYDSVSSFVSQTQMALDFLDYSVDRTDGYFDESTQAALIQFQKDHDLEPTGVLSPTDFDAVISAVTKEWSLNKDKDNQLQKAIEVLNG